MKKINFAAVVLVAVLAGVSRAGDFSSDAVGTAGAQFLEIPVTARAVAMGSAQGAAVEDASALYYNPAGLAGVKNGDVSFTHAFYFQSINYDYLALAKRFGGLVWGAQVQYLSPGSMDEIDNTGAGTGNTFHPRDLAVGFGLGFNLGILDLGAGGKYIYSNLDDTASTVALDLGTRARLSEKLALSFSAANMGPGLKYRNTRDSLPFTLRFGSAYKTSDFTLAADVVAPKAAAVYYAVGGEYLFPMKAVSLAARAGYNSRTSTSKLGGLTGLNAGGGIAMGSASLDYAWSPFGDLGTAHRMSLNYKW